MSEVENAVQDEDVIRRQIRHLCSVKFRERKVPSAVYEELSERIDGIDRPVVLLEDIWKLGIVVDDEFVRRVCEGELPRHSRVGSQLYFPNPVELVRTYYELGELNEAEETLLDEFVRDVLQ